MQNFDIKTPILRKFNRKIKILSIIIPDWNLQSVCPSDKILSNSAGADRKLQFSALPTFFNLQQGNPPLFSSKVSRWLEQRETEQWNRWTDAERSYVAQHGTHSTGHPDHDFKQRGTHYSSLDLSQNTNMFLVRRNPPDRKVFHIPSTCVKKVVP